MPEQIYKWGEAPPNLKTRKQLAAEGLRPNRGVKPVGRIEWKQGKKWADLFSTEDATKKRAPSPAQLEAIAARQLKARTCPGCRTVFSHHLGRRWDTEDCPFCCMEAAAGQAERILAANPLFLDFETSTLGGYAVELAIIDAQENVLFNERINPQVPIDPEASAIHGIHDDNVCNAPTFAERHEKICELLRGRMVVAYNARFDRDVLRSELERMNAPKIKIQWECAMELLMAYHGSEYPEKLGGNHSALGDCFAVIRLVRGIANKDV